MVYRLSHALANAGHQVEVIHCLDSFDCLSPGGPVSGYPEHPGVRVHGLRTGWRGLSPFLTQQLGRPVLKQKAIEEILDAGQFDVIHYHNISLLGGPNVLGLGSAIKLYSIHEYWLVCPTHTLFRDDERVCQAPACFRCQLVYRRPPQLWRHGSMIQRNLGHVDRFIAPLEGLRGVFSRRGLDVPMSVLPWFTPQTSTQSPRKERLNDGRPYALFVGRLEKLKGLQDVLPLFEAGFPLELVVAGEGMYEAELRARVPEGGQVRFLGRCDADELAGWYEDAVALLVPSLCLEIFALVIAEAFERGTPVLMRKQPELRSLVEESGAGMMYGSIADLEAQLRRLLDDPDHRVELGLRARSYYESTLCEERHLAHYLALIEAVEKDRRGG